MHLIKLGSSDIMRARGLGLKLRMALLMIGAAVVLAACGGDDSSGPSQVSVPSVVGDTQAAATAAITGAGLTLGTVTQASSATVASGSVISQTPAGGASAAGGASVALVVSSGPAPVAVPNVVGNTQAAATTAITGAGLTVGTLTQATSATVVAGDVISENPAAGTSVASGSAVTLVISTGPQTYTVGGTLIGLSANASVQILNGADTVPVSANGSFALPTAVVSGGTYSVTVGTPSSAQICGVQNATGTVASANVTNILVYCTFTVSAATLHKAYTTVAADFANSNGGTAVPVDLVGADTYDGVGTTSATVTVNAAGTIVSNVQESGTYTVTTTNAIPSLNGYGGIEGVNADSVAAVSTTSGTPPTIAIGVVPNANATTNSINGNYTLVDISAQLSTGIVYGYEATITVNNGTVTGTYTQNMGGTITTGNPASAQWTVTNGILTSVGSASGAVSNDGDLIVLADTNSGDDPYVNVAVLRGTGVTPATFEGVYSVSEYGGTPVTSTFGKAITLLAYGNGSYSVIYTKNANGNITTNNTDTGTYTVAADGTLTITDSEGDVYNGAMSADGNALVLASVASAQNPAIFVGVRQ
jgi:PASTA domain